VPPDGEPDKKLSARFMGGLLFSGPLPSHGLPTLRVGTRENEENMKN
jgi:hypothetical protein